MSRLVDDELWELVEPLLPPEPENPKGGRPRVSSRGALESIVYVLRSGVPWRMLPKEEFGCSGVTCWRRLGDWKEAGVNQETAYRSRGVSRSMQHWIPGAPTGELLEVLEASLFRFLKTDL